MSVSATQVKALRDRTGAGMMDAKKALMDANGDEEKAVEILRQKGIATAEKKSGRSAAEGMVQAKVAADGKTGALIEVNCETDFAGKGPDFQKLVEDLANHALAKMPASVEEALAQPLASDSSKTVQERVTDAIAVVKENMNFRRVVCKKASTPGGIVHAYIHGGGKMGVLLELSAEKAGTASNPAFKALANDMGLQIVGNYAEYVSRADVPQDVIDHETQVEMGKEDIQSKPENIREKIVQGRVDKLIAQQVLLEQEFLKDPDKKVEQVVQAAAKELGDTISVKCFTRFVLGAGVEKTEEEAAPAACAV